MAIDVEIWSSSDNKTEVHTFSAGDRNTYILGFNPELIPVEDVREFLADYGYALARSVNDDLG